MATFHGNSDALASTTTSHARIAFAEMLPVSVTCFRTQPPDALCRAARTARGIADAPSIPVIASVFAKEYESTQPIAELSSLEARVRTSISFFADSAVRDLIVKSGRKILALAGMPAEIAILHTALARASRALVLGRGGNMIEPRRHRWRVLTAAAGFALAALPVHADVTVKEGQLLRDGRAWAPHGVVEIAFVAPPAAQKGVFREAYQHYAAGDYVEMRLRGIDSVRMQVSQPGLDPQGPLFDPVFRTNVIGAVRAARAAGLAVIVSVQDEAQSGEASVASLPNDATARVWRSLAPEFAGDGSVMYELLNEPNLPPSPAHWQMWSLAMNRMIGVVRATGARNVVVADGLLFAERLGAAPDLRDPISQVVYASHPYAHDAEGQTPASWDAKFGQFARRHPVIVTEWTTVPQYYCDSETPGYAADFLRYLTGRGIGITVYAWDFSGPKFGSAFHGLPATASTYQRKRCGDDGFGPGQLIEQLYRQGSK